MPRNREDSILIMDQKGVMTESDSSFVPSAFQFVTVGVIGTCVNIIGILANVIAIWVLLHRTTRKSSSIAFLVALSVADLLLLFIQEILYSIPTICTYKRHFNCRQSIMDHELILTLFHRILHTISTWVTVALSLERCLAVVRPFQAAAGLTTKRTFRVIFGICLASVIVQLPFIVFTVQLMAKGAPSYFFLTSYYNLFYLVILRVVLNFVLPFVILVLTNIAIVRELASSQRYRKNLGNAAMRRATSKEDATISTVCFAICAAFLFFLLPYKIWLSVWEIKWSSADYSSPLPLNRNYSAVGFPFFSDLGAINGNFSEIGGVAINGTPGDEKTEKELAIHRFWKRVGNGSSSGSNPWSDHHLARFHDFGLLGFSINSAINFLLYVCISPSFRSTLRRVLATQRCYKRRRRDTRGASLAASLASPRSELDERGSDQTIQMSFLHETTPNGNGGATFAGGGDVTMDEVDINDEPSKPLKNKHNL